MIKSGYRSVNESVSGPLASALKQMDQRQKNSFIWAMKGSNIDFNRSISKAEKISANDPRLKINGNIIIGVYYDEDDKPCITAYKIGNGPIVTSNNSSTRIKDNSGKLIRIPDFASVSWKKWVSIMTAFYIIEKDKAPSFRDIRSKREASTSTTVEISKELTNKVKEIVSRYGYSIIKFRDQSLKNLKNITINNNDPTSNIQVVYDNGKGFLISTTGTWVDEASAIKMRDDMNKAIEMIHKLNQINFDKVGRIGGGSIYD